jgi:nucleotide-binding universal stress UspA family protein
VGRLFLEREPAVALIERSHELDLLVMGSRGYGPLHAVLLGAVSGRVIRDAACPVIVVPRGAKVPLEGLLATGQATA